MSRLPARSVAQDELSRVLVEKAGDLSEPKVDERIQRRNVHHAPGDEALMPSDA